MRKSMTKETGLEDSGNRAKPVTVTCLSVTSSDRLYVFDPVNSRYVETGTQPELPREGCNV